jgi:hypothetical protein
VPKNGAILKRKETKQQPIMMLGNEGIYQNAHAMALARPANTCKRRGRKNALETFKERGRPFLS